LFVDKKMVLFLPDFECRSPAVDEHDWADDGQMERWFTCKRLFHTQANKSV